MIPDFVCRGAGVPLCECWLSGPFAGPDFFVPHPLVRPCVGTCGRFFPNRSGTGQRGGGFGRLYARSCAVSLQSASMCRHAGPECPSGGAPGAGASSLPATDSTSLFQQVSLPEAGLRLSSFGTAGPRPELPASFAPRLPASLTPGRSGSPRPGSGDMVSYGRGVGSPGQDASGSPQIIPNKNNIFCCSRTSGHALHHGFCGGRSRFSKASRSPLRQRIFPQ